MEVRVRERLIGALVLVGIVVLLVPAILTGGPERDAPDQPDDPETATRSVEIRMDDGLPAADRDVLVPEPGPATATAAARKEPAAPVQAPAPGPDLVPATPTAAPAAAQGAATGQAAPAAVRTPADAAERPAWAVQLGAFSSRDKADRLVSDLRRKGYAAFVLEYRETGRVLHRVRVGPEQDRAKAAAIAERLRKDGFQTVVAAHP